MWVTYVRWVKEGRGEEVVEEGEMAEVPWGTEVGEGGELDQAGETDKVGWVR